MYIWVNDTDKLIADKLILSTLNIGTSDSILNYNAISRNIERYFEINEQ